MKKITIIDDPELGEIDTEVGAEDLDELADRIADVDPERQSQKDDLIIWDPELGEIDTMVGKTDLDDLGEKIASVDHKRPDQEKE